MPKPKNLTKFSESWLKRCLHPTWTWLSRVKSDSTRALCNICNKDFDVSNMGMSAIASHEKGKKHMSRCTSASSRDVLETLQEHVTLTSVTHDTSPLPVSVEQQSSMTATSSSAHSSRTVLPEQVDAPVVPATPSIISVSKVGLQAVGVSRYLIKDEVSKAEIIWALNSIMSHSSLRSTGNASHLFKLMFPDSAIAEGFQMQKDKASYVVTYGIGPYFQEQLISQVKSCLFYSVSFDESLNKVAQQGQMDIVLRFWNESTNEIDTRYLTSTFLGHATAVDLLNSFTSALCSQNLNLKRLLQVSMDGPNVNLKFLTELKAYLKREQDPDDPLLFEIGTCSLHIVHGAYKTAHNVCGWKVNDFLRSLYYTFKDFPSRRSDYTAASQSTVFPLRFCAIRWVENSAVIQRALDILPFVKLYVAAVTKKPPASQSFKKVQQALTDTMLPAKLGFMRSVALQLEPFLTKYQSNKPLLPFMYQDLFNLLKDLMARFVKVDVMKGVTNGSNIVAVDLNKKENMKTLQNLDIGFGASAACKGANGVNVLQFREECMTYLQNLCTKLANKYPLKYKIVKGATCLNPDVMLNESVRQSRLKCALETFIEQKRLSAGDADIIKRSYEDLCNNKDVKLKLTEFKSDRDRLDVMLWGLLEDREVPKVMNTFVQQILCLFHGNASVERSFSINKECLVENLHNDSLIAQRIVYDAVLAVGGVSSVKISKQMIQSVRNASSRRVEASKKRVLEVETESRKRKLIADDIKELEAKKARIEQTAKEETSTVNEELKKLRVALKN